jgi:DNA-dependent protein kinase catalytic subunit
MMKKFVAWDSEKRLSFAVPFTDMKPVIYLDPFLPRITELALSTSDRQTKVWPLKTNIYILQGS